MDDFTNIIGQVEVPEGNEFYGFKENLLQAYYRFQSILKDYALLSPERYVSSDLPIKKYIDFPFDISASFQNELVLPRVRTSGRPIILLEPHADDLPLSLGGSLFAWARPIVVVTIFSNSRNLHPQIRKHKDLNFDQISALRKIESKAGLACFAAEHICLDLWEACWPHRRPESARVEQLVDLLQPIVAKYKDAEILAPACTSTHPDHILTRLTAERLDCKWFYEDVDFFANYARSIEDREYCYNRWGLLPKLCHQDISRFILHKFSLLSFYQSQFFPLQEMGGVLRYNWAVGSEYRRLSAKKVKGLYFERTYRKDQ